MKTNILSKGKWYIFGAIAVVLIMSIGLSFCVWDNVSLKQLSMASGTGNYGKDYAMQLDANNNGKGDVGDTIYFGNYYQEINETTKSQLLWRVVDIVEEKGEQVMYLLNERVLAFGNFCGRDYKFDADGNKIEIWNVFNSRYNDSTLRAWLNSETRIVDTGVGFANTPNGNHVVFNGFYNEAFSPTEKSRIIGRNIGGAKGGTINSAAIVPYADMVNQKVWTPSITEMYGRIQVTQLSWSTGELLETAFNNDNINDKQFDYFAARDNVAKRGVTTKFATSRTVNGLANYSMPGLHHIGNISNAALNSESNVGWWTRSPGVSTSTALIVNWNGDIYPYAYGSYGNTIGVRPAICLAR